MSRPKSSTQCHVVLDGKPTFRRKLFPPSSASKNKISIYQTAVDSCCPEYRDEMFLQNVGFQWTKQSYMPETELFITTGVTASNPAYT
jgi:hypothetical protein